MDLLSSRCLCFLLLLHLLSSPAKGGVEDSGAPTPIRKLFVFGDSYADTGNLNKYLSRSWKFPYGLTFPGRPSGRFSDGRLLTDYIAKLLGTKSPIPYQQTRYRSKWLQYGMNFAYGGTGVFDTGVPWPNMTGQIDILEKLIGESLYTKADLQTSVVLVTLSGNDYDSYYKKGGTSQGLQSFITEVVKQLAANLKRIEAVGASRIAVTALQPLGCLPRATVSSSFQQCNATENTSVNFHNHLLQQAVGKLNNESNVSRPVFTILDMYTLFTAVIKNKGNQQGDLKFENPLKPCCMGLSSENSCGSVDEKGAKMYTVCKNPESAFFWDTVHPTQSGWSAIYSDLKATLDQNL